MADTTRTQIPAEVNNFYSRSILETAVPALIHSRFAETIDIPANSGTDTIKFRNYAALAAQTTALTEGVTPSGKQLSVTDITATVLYYGDYVTLTDKVTYETFDPILTQAAIALGNQVGDSLDQLGRDVLVAGTTVQYASTASARTDITAAMKLTRAEVKEMVRTLQTNKAKPVTSMVNPSTGYNTTPINRAFIGIISEDTLYDLDDATGWIPVEKYSNKSDVMEDEVGSLAGVRFLMTTNAKVFAGGGADSVDVHATLIFGRNAYAQTRISGKTLENIVMPLGSAGTADALKQRLTTGWKLSYVMKITNQSNIGRIEHGVTA